MQETQMQADRRVLVVVDAVEVLVLRRLMRQAIPMLKRPQDFGSEKRRMLAHTIILALDGMDADREEDEE